MPDLEFGYTNHRGEYGRRRVSVTKIYFTDNPPSPYYTDPGWYIEGFDYDKKAMRTFALVKAVFGPNAPAMAGALQPLVAIADAYDANALDDEARKFWGENNENENQRDPKEIELYAGRGGKRLLTLQQCFDARDALKLWS